VHFSKASIISFNAIVLLPRYPPSDVMTILHSLSIIRLLQGKNPAKTTECMAPILAQAKMETANGIIGK
jgi:hypothetical protein